ncbi:hypothetical protein GQ607_006724, partial [Colletotrichum asianum]
FAHLETPHIPRQAPCIPPQPLSLCLPLQHLPRRQSGLVSSDSASTKRFRPRIRRAPTADRRLTDGRMQHSLMHSRASVCTACRGTSAIRSSPISAFSSVSPVQCHLSRPSCVSAARILRTAYPPRTSPSFDNSRVPRTCIPLQSLAEGTGWWWVAAQHV